jgi:hypothetical protein
VNEEILLTLLLVFMNMFELLLVPNMFTFCAEFDVLNSIPDIIDSPYIKIDPCVRVLYYQTLYYGLYKIHGPGNKLAQEAYYKALESVPVWLAGATGTVLDVCTATLIVGHSTLHSSSCTDIGRLGRRSITLIINLLGNSTVRPLNFCV